jgi:hypothetical protein
MSKKIYNGNFKDMVYGELPNEEAVLKTLKMINERLRIVSWKINTELNK